MRPTSPAPVDTLAILHGMRASYRRGCRCWSCKLANSRGGQATRFDMSPAPFLIGESYGRGRATSAAWWPTPATFANCG